eukprot:scaffold1963_cov242-Pinguiococcus_pyrenoidosus.AAC.9
MAHARLFRRPRTVTDGRQARARARARRSPQKSRGATAAQEALSAERPRPRGREARSVRHSRSAALHARSADTLCGATARVSRRILARKASGAIRQASITQETPQLRRLERDGKFRKAGEAAVLSLAPVAADVGRQAGQAPGDAPEAAPDAQQRGGVPPEGALQEHHAELRRPSTARREGLQLQAGSAARGRSDAQAEAEVGAAEPRGRWLLQGLLQPDSRERRRRRSRHLGRGFYGPGGAVRQDEVPVCRAQGGEVWLSHQHAAEHVGVCDVLWLAFCGWHGGPDLCARDRARGDGHRAGPARHEHGVRALPGGGGGHARPRGPGSLQAGAHRDRGAGHGWPRGSSDRDGGRQHEQRVLQGAGGLRLHGQLVQSLPRERLGRRLHLRCMQPLVLARGLLWDGVRAVPRAHLEPSDDHHLAHRRVSDRAAFLPRHPRPALRLPDPDDAHAKVLHRRGLPGPRDVPGSCAAGEQGLLEEATCPTAIQGVRRRGVCLRGVCLRGVCPRGICLRGGLLGRSGSRVSKQPCRFPLLLDQGRRCASPSSTFRDKFHSILFHSILFLSAAPGRKDLALKAENEWKRSWLRGRRCNQWFTREEGLHVLGLHVGQLRTLQTITARPTPFCEPGSQPSRGWRRLRSPRPVWLHGRQRKRLSDASSPRGTDSADIPRAAAFALIAAIRSFPPPPPAAAFPVEAVRPAGVELEQ